MKTLAFVTWKHSTACVSVLLLLTTPPTVQAQFNHTTNNGTITITGYTGPGGDVTIPDTINGLPVTSIGDFAFWNLANVTSVTIPNSVVSLGGAAFEGCALSSVTIGSGVANIGNYTFDGCTSLTNVTFGNSVTTIGVYAFSVCTSLTTLRIPDSVLSVMSGAFYECLSLTNVTIGNSVTNIGDYAFSGCDSLNSVTIGTSVTSIEGGAFEGNRPIIFYFKGNAPVADGSAFMNANGLVFATAYYLPGTTGWSAFSFNTGVPAVLWNPLIQTGDASFGVRTNQFGFNIVWADGKAVLVEACTNLHNPLWTPVATNTFTGDSSYFSDPQWTNHPARFYRLHSP